MSLPYHSERVEEAGRRFDETGCRFEVTTTPDDLRILIQEGEGTTATRIGWRSMW